jgi:hypothetical protein
MAQFDTDGDSNGIFEAEDVCRTVIERSTDRPDRCTIYDTDVSGKMSATRWVAAAEGSFVFSELMR